MPYLGPAGVPAQTDQTTSGRTASPLRTATTTTTTTSYPVLAVAGPGASPTPDPFLYIGGQADRGQSIGPFDSRHAGSVANARADFRSHFYSNFGPALFGGKRDLYRALGYPNEIFTGHYRTWYERGDIAARLIEFYPQSTWLPSVSVNENDDPDIETPLERLWNAFNRRLNVVADIFMRADILACTFRYSVIVIGAPGELNTPLPRGTGTPDTIKFLTVLPEDRATITKVVGQDGLDENGLSPRSLGYIDPVTSPRFGLPLTYKCKLGIAANYFASDGTASQSGFLAEKDVHWTRIWHVAQSCLDNKIYGQPMLRRVANVLIDYYKLRGAVAEGVWRWADPKIHFDLDSTLDLPADEDAENYQAQIDALRHGQDSIIKTRGITSKILAAPVVDMADNIMTLLRAIGASHGIPARVLSGSEEAKLAGGQDDGNTNDRQTERWGNYATPQLSGFILYLAENGYFPVPERLTVKWPEIEEHTEVEKASIASSMALANLNQINAGDTEILTSMEMRTELFGRNDAPVMPTLPTTGTRDDIASDDPTTNPNPDPVTEPRSASDSSVADSSDSSARTRRVLIIGGPRRGKSTIARTLRESGIPTYCGDPKSTVKDLEDGVTYLPENLAWSESSAYVAENWLTQPGPWCCEGVSMARAVRKLVNSERTGTLDSVEIIVLTEAADGVTESAGQAVMAKGVMTVWAEVADLFPQAKVIGERNPTQQARQNINSNNTDSWRVSMPAGRTATASRKNHKSSPRYCFRVL